MLLSHPCHHAVSPGRGIALPENIGGSLKGNIRRGQLFSRHTVVEHEHILEEIDGGSDRNAVQDIHQLGSPGGRNLGVI